MWLCSSDLKGEMESSIIAAQDQVLNTHLPFEEHHDTTDSKCGMCYEAEHIKHTVVVGCTKLAPSEYTNRHNRVAGYIHWMICKHMGLQVTDRYYEHIP